MYMYMLSWIATCTCICLVIIIHQYLLPFVPSNDKGFLTWTMSEMSCSNRHRGIGLQVITIIDYYTITTGALTWYNCSFLSSNSSKVDAEPGPNVHVTHKIE